MTVVHTKRAGTSTARPASRKTAQVLHAVHAARAPDSEHEIRVDPSPMQRAMHHARSRQAKRRA